MAAAALCAFTSVGACPVQRGTIRSLSLTTSRDVRGSLGSRLGVGRKEGIEDFCRPPSATTDRGRVRAITRTSRTSAPTMFASGFDASTR